VVGFARDGNCNASSLIGVEGDADGGANTYGIAGSAEIAVEPVM